MPHPMPGERPREGQAPRPRPLGARPRAARRRPRAPGRAGTPPSSRAQPPARWPRRSPPPAPGAPPAPGPARAPPPPAAAPELAAGEAAFAERGDPFRLAEALRDFRAAADLAPSDPVPLIALARA